MQIPIVVNGRLVGPTHIELDEPVAGLQGDVEVALRARESATASDRQSFLDFLKSLPRGTRTREDIDKQIQEERASWEDDE